MPQLSDLLEKKKKFLKKNYRPWDFSGTGTVDNNEVPSNPSPPPKNDDVKTTALPSSQNIPFDNNTPTSFLTGNKRDNVSGNNQATYEQQSDNIEVTQKKQPGNIQGTSRIQPDDRTGNVTDNIIHVHALTENIKKLTGIQKKIFYYVIDVCSARGQLDTGNVLSVELAEKANCSFGSAKTSLIRLIEKKLILRLQGKACRGGHLVLGLTKEFLAAAMQAQQALFNPLKMTYTGNVMDNNTGNTSPYSSSSYNNTTTALPPEWQKIDYEPLRKIGFSETQLRQLYESSNNPEVIQTSIYHFAFALAHKEKVKGYSDPLNVLMGVLRKGQCWFETDYVSPQELSLQKLLDAKKQQKERLDAMIKELIELEFPDWRKKLTPEELKNIVPEHTLKTNISSAINASLRIYFTETILLPKLQRDGLIENV